MDIGLISPLATLRERAKSMVEDHHRQYANSQKDNAHILKREEAERLAALPTAQREKSAVAWFVEAAAVEGMSVAELVDTILLKPNKIMDYENGRRRAVKRVLDAATEEELQAIIDECAPNRGDLIPT